MDRWRSICRAVSLVVGLMLMAHPVCAQTGRPARPFRSLFGSTDANRPSLHTLDLRLSLSGAADDGLAASSVAESPSRANFQQLYSASGTLAYTLRGRRFGAGVTGSGNLPYYPGTHGQLSDNMGYGANANLSFTSRSLSLSSYGSYTYSPYYAMALDAAAAPGPSAQPFDYASARNPNDIISAGASLTRRFGRRTSASLAYGFNNSSFQTGDRSSRSQDARISANRQLSRRFSLRGSYGYREGYFATAATRTTNGSQDGDLGLGYTRPSPRGRATTIDLSLGSSVVRDGFSPRPIWRGSARVSRTVNAGWTAGVGFSRTLQFNGLLQQSVVADAATADVSGRFGRRVNLSLAATYSNGQRAAQGGQGFDIYSGSAGAQVGLASFAAINAQYIYYRYDFPAGYELPAGVPVRMNRQRLQIGASFWLPIARAGRAATSPSSVSQ